jgi:APA family basic amino acid/polyamine antiporter
MRLMELTELTGGAMSKQNTLLRVLGGAFAVAVTVGATIGVGILRTPASIAAQLHNGGLILGAWLLGGVYILMASLSVAELATMLPQAGGFYVYTRRALGDGAGFVAGWVDWLTNCAGMAYLAVSMADFSATLWPAAHGAPMAALFIIFFALLHWRGTSISGRAQEITCALQACAFVVLIVACFAFAGPPSSSTPQHVLTGNEASLWISLVIALRLIIGTYDGWYGAIYFSEEVKGQAQVLPRSMITGIMAVILVYILVNGGLLHVLPISVLAKSELPAADAAKVIFGASGGAVVTFLALISLPAVLNAALLCASRIPLAMSRDGLFWGRASYVSPRGTPLVSLALSTLVGIGLALSGTFEQLLVLAAVLDVLTYCSALISLMVLRRREAELPRPFTAKPYPAVTLVALTVGCAFLIAALMEDPRNSLKALSIVAISYPGFYAARWFRAGRVV